MGNFNFGTIKSYVSNLPVDALVWETNDGLSWNPERTLVSGGFSSDIGVPLLGAGNDDYVCMGNGRPWNM
ncbi:hypothetical protein [Streptomyces sp. NPDC048473]